MFSAVHLYSPSSSPVTRVNLITPPERISAMGARGLLSTLVQLMEGARIPVRGRHWYSVLPPVTMV